MIVDEEYLEHYGTPRKSGRYPWGSGDNAQQGNKDFLDYVRDLRKQGLSDTVIAEGLGISTTELRAKQTIENNARKRDQIFRAEQLKEKNYSISAIGREMGLNESSVRALLAPGAKEKADSLLLISNMLKDEVEKYGYIDIGKGVENHMKVSKERLRSAVAILKEQGYKVHYLSVQQLGTGKDTSLIVLGGPDSTGKEAYQYKRENKLRLPTVVSDDYGKTFSGDLGLLPPLSVNPKRVAIRYAEDGGTEADGVIYIRPDVPDISLGKSRYAQVRVLVGDKHYLKGMAVYKDDLPDGVDLLFNTNKSDTGNKLDALKKITEDPDNPFGAIVSQIREQNPDGTRGRVISAMNLVNEEGQWDTWSRNLSTQVLSKQSVSLAKAQLDMTYENRVAEYKTIMEMTNPTVRRKLLKEFSDGTDASAVHLKAASLPRQSTRVILPIESLPPTQIYAPSYTNGETVALIRYPHGGTFEIPELIVNNRHPQARKILGDSPDAVGINSKVAERLSGADFDGDTVLVIPNRGVRQLKVSGALEGLRNFNPRVQYKRPDGVKPISEKFMQTQMGDISNLITDMTIRKASKEELARAVKHSMVVIDAYKHDLDYRQSAKDNNIAQLKAKYQTGATSGATTLISRAKSEVRIPDRLPRRAAQGGPINKETGKLEFVPTGKTYTNKQGEVIPVMIKTQRLKETDDASTLSSGTPIERVYVDHSNRLKALANQARLDLVNTPLSKRDPSAAKTYAKEVASLKSKLTLALQNAPLERQAQLLAGTIVSARLQNNSSIDKTQRKRIEAQALAEARIRTGAKKIKVKISKEEWDAIQAGAVSDNVLSSILDNADMDVVRELATPKTKVLMSDAKTKRAKAMLELGYTTEEVASALGVSKTTLNDAVNT